MDVCILTAGRGTRLGTQGQGMNKGLLPLQGKAALTHLIERFPDGTRFVVAVGYLAAQVEEYLRLAHPEIALDLVHVLPFEGPGTGPGSSTLACESRLPGPFFLVCADTYWPESGAITSEPQRSTVWVGLVPEGERNAYCNLRVENGRVRAILDKVYDPSAESRAYTGLTFIQDRDAFFSGIRSSVAIQGEVQISSGLRALLTQGELDALPLEGWRDLGTSARYEQARAELEEQRFEKEDEAFFHVDDRVLKFFNDPMIVSNRLARARLRPELFPEILGSGGNIYSYRFVEGHTLSDAPRIEDIDELLEWMSSSVWKRPAELPREFTAQCRAFYRARVGARVTHAEAALTQTDCSNGALNDVITPSVRSLLQEVPWEEISAGIPAFIHGDLQLDNVVVRTGGTRTDRFRLIDWRQDFADAIEWGDLYYDFAKLLASIDLDFRAVSRGEFELAGPGTEAVSFSCSGVRGKEQLRASVEHCARSVHGLDLERLNLHVALVYLGMSGIHPGETSRLLYFFGRAALARALASHKTRLTETPRVQALVCNPFCQGGTPGLV